MGSRGECPSLAPWCLAAAPLVRFLPSPYRQELSLALTWVSIQAQERPAAATASSLSETKRTFSTSRSGSRDGDSAVSYRLCAQDPEPVSDRRKCFRHGHAVLRIRSQPFSFLWHKSCSLLEVPTLEAAGPPQTKTRDLPWRGPEVLTGTAFVVLK